MFWDFKFTVKNQNFPNCRIVADFFHETPIRAFFRGFQTNCTTRKVAGKMIISGSRIPKSSGGLVFILAGIIGCLV